MVFIENLNNSTYILLLILWVLVAKKHGKRTMIKKAGHKSVSKRTGFT
ncbi:hypothetical protein [Halothermothrix orenii]|nr:hypothetical protein [Halothermothrix orenii]